MYKYYLFRWLSLTLGRLPAWFIYRLGTVIGEMAFLVNRKVRQRVYDNLRHVMDPQTSAPRIRNAARGTFHNATYYYCDLVRLPHLDAAYVNEKITVHDYDQITCALETGRGVILASAHYGNPELAVQALAARGLRLMALTEPLNPSALSRLFDGWRSHLGHDFRPVGLSSMKAAMRSLRRGGAVAILVDRDLQPTGITVPFCGTPTKMPVGAVEMALRTGAVLLPVFVHRRRRDELEAFVHPPLDLLRTGDMEADVRTNVQALLSRFEPYLRRDPTQWIVLEQVWDGR